MAAAFADCLGDIALAMPELSHQAAVGLRLLERCQILPLEILDERDLQDLGIAKRPDDDRHLVQSGTLRRSPAPFARDQLEFRPRVAGISNDIINQIVDRPHQERLDDALFANRLHEAVELGFDKAPPRLERRRTDCLDRHRTRRPWPGQDATLAEQFGQTAPELRPLRPIADAPAHAAAPRRSRGTPEFRRSISIARLADASEPAQTGSYINTGMPCDGASDTRTLRGITVLKTLSPRCRRTSSATSSDKLFRWSYIVSSTPSSTRRGLSPCCTRSIVRISCASPSRA